MKLDALEDVLEEAGGSPVLCSYTFKSDAERIMKRFKKYKPVNLTNTPSKDTERIINDWNNGKVKLLIGHPACLHPSTEVLTEWNGWVKIVDVKKSDRVFDGVEFVNHDGCSYSGYKPVTDVFGITMTHDHKLLIDNEWVEADHVENSEKAKRKALYKYQGDDCRISSMLSMPYRVQDHSPECSQTQPTETNPLSALRSRSLSQPHRYTHSSDMVWNEGSRKRSTRQKLRRAWDHNVSRMGRFSDFLQRHARRVFGRTHHRAGRCEQTLLQRQLHMGNPIQTASEQTNESVCDIPRGEYTLSRVNTAIWRQQDNANHAVKSWDECRRSRAGRTRLPLREELRPEERIASGSEKAHVYDLVNCGPRHRFIIRNSDGEAFVSHNSMGHGVDGLQDSGSILVWFGLNWSLELYEQMNGRINRQGQQHPVSVIRILCRDTIDLAVADALERKTDDQEGLKSALQRYRDGVTTNDLEVNFF